LTESQKFIRTFVFISILYIFFESTFFILKEGHENYYKKLDEKKFNICLYLIAVSAFLTLIYLLDIFQTPREYTPKSIT